MATAAFLLAALSGVVLAVPYDPARAYDSLATLLLSDPPGTFFRNFHYWSGQLCLVLSVLHLWDHLRVGTEGRTRSGVWLRLSLTLPVMTFLMLSGFLLRGDADSQQALRIVSRILGEIPGLGAPLVTLLFGRGGRLDLVYIQHAATATVLVWFFIVEHARRLWPRSRAFLISGSTAVALSLFLSPGLHDGLDPVVKGPWYFLGLQEILHWTRWPAVVLIGAAALVALIFALKHMPLPWARRGKRALLAVGGAYLFLCAVGAFLRGESWAWAPTWPAGGGNLVAGWIFARTPAAPMPLPLVQGHPEGCLVCHAGVTGLGNAHRPEAVGCASCHGGNPLTLQKQRAHVGLRLIPGNLADAEQSCGTSACHASIMPRVERSVMTTMAGVVAVDRLAFGEEPAPGGLLPRVDALGRSPADTHLRQLCAGCHLGTRKSEFGPDPDQGVGGGCNACHLAYDPASRQALATYQREKEAGNARPPTAHPALSLAVDNSRCFNCHSRSGRISTSYEGWMEMLDPPDSLRGLATVPNAKYRTLADDRVFERETPDIHFEKGLDCVDCHTAQEVMGDGKAHAFKRDQLRIACVDCHQKPGAPPRYAEASTLDPESKRLVGLRAKAGAPPMAFLLTPRGDALANAIRDARTGQPQLLQKRTGRSWPLRPQAEVCSSTSHARLACGTCHTAWTPSCASCHTAYDSGAASYDWVDQKDVVGAWREKAQGFEARPPTLGVQVPSSGGPGTVQTFAPGMVMTLQVHGHESFQRLYARVEPHTSRKVPRSCQSCHNDPQALGYGRGKLAFVRKGGAWGWTFTPALPPGPDGLPADAWIPFLRAWTGRVSTRPDVRPFTIEEQRRILTVGACLTCHLEGSRIMRESLRSFENLVRDRGPDCRLPQWNVREPGKHPAVP